MEDKITVQCKLCNRNYTFKKQWLKKNNPDNFICRICKINETTKSDKFKLECRKRSKELFTSEDLRLKISQLAIYHNILNKDKISKKLKEHYNIEENKQKISKLIQERWKDETYKNEISFKISKKWNDPDYRGKILGSRTKSRINIKIIKLLKNKQVSYQRNFCIGIYMFELLINNIILYDKIKTKEKELFLNHFFPNYQYIDQTLIYNIIDQSPSSSSSLSSS